MSNIRRPYSRHAAFTMDDELAAEIHKFQQAEGCSNQAEAIKMLCRISLANNPALGAIHAEMIRAFNEVRVWAMREISIRMLEVRDMLMASIKGAGTEHSKLGAG